MAYVRTHWVSRTTPLSAENMNNIEDGIAEAKAAANGNNSMWSFIMDKISSVLGLTSSQYSGNAATVNGHTVESDVPANAVFTDTTYQNATESSDGLMSAADKAKLNGLGETFGVGTVAKSIMLNSRLSSPDTEYISIPADTQESVGVIGVNVRNISTSSQIPKFALVGFGATGTNLWVKFLNSDSASVSFTVEVTYLYRVLDIT